MKVLRPTIGFPAWGPGIGRRPQRIRLWRPVGFNYKNSTGLGEAETTLVGYTQELTYTRTQGKKWWPCKTSIQFSHSVMSDSLQPHGFWHARLLCPSPVPGASSNSCPSSRWCRPTISSSVVPSVPAFILCNISVLSKESVLLIRWPKYLSFSFSIRPSNEYSVLISFRIDWFDLLTVQGTLQESYSTPKLKSISSLVLNFFYSPTLTSIHDY